jgi:hypothetical protein
LGGGISSDPEELVDVPEGGLIDPIQDHQFGAQVQLFHLSAPQIQDLGRRSEFAVQDQSQADIFDPTFRKICLVNAPVLDHCPTQRDFTNTRHIGHCFGPRQRLWRSEIWGQLRHLEPPSIRSSRWKSRDLNDNHLFTGLARMMFSTEPPNGANFSDRLQPQPSPGIFRLLRVSPLCPEHS